MSKYSYNDQPICPYCDWTSEDPMVWSELGISDKQEEISVICCPNCSKKFEITTHVSWNFTTIGLDCPKHQLKKIYENSEGSIIRYICQTCKKEIYSFELENGKYQKYNKNQYVIL